jgi:hypothetical protein
MQQSWRVFVEKVLPYRFLGVARCCKREFLSRRLRNFHARITLDLWSRIDLRLYAPIFGVRLSPTGDA